MEHHHFEWENATKFLWPWLPGADISEALPSLLPKTLAEALGPVADASELKEAVEAQKIQWVVNGRNHRKTIGKWWFNGT